MVHLSRMTGTAEKAAQDGSDEIFLVDGSGYIFRAYFALPQSLTNPRGEPVGAVLGFVNMILKLLTDLHAPYIAVIFDAARANFRNEIYADYKANRDETPADLIPQFAMIRAATEAFGIPALEIEGYEADDLIATYARIAGEQGRKVTIVGSDKDLMQLVGDEGQIYRARGCDREIRRAAREGDRRAGARGRCDRQHPRRARHRHQDRGAADRRIRRP
jgi:DNA polymerase-1